LTLILMRDIMRYHFKQRSENEKEN